MHLDANENSLKLLEKLTNQLNRDFDNLINILSMPINKRRIKHLKELKEYFKNLEFFK